MSHTWTTGQAAAKLGVSIRTIRYYDQIGLVIPGKKEAGGRRLYTEEDLLRLEKISLLKSLSLPLDEIRHLLDELSIGQILEAHRKHLKKKLENLQESLNNTNALLNLLEAEGKIRWETLLPLVKGSKERTVSWESYFEEEELLVLKAKLPRLEGSDELTRGWVQVIARVERCLREGLEPESGEGKAIAEEMERLSELTFGGDRKLMNKFWELRRDPASAKHGLAPIREEALAFVEACFASHEFHLPSSEIVTGNPISEAEGSVNKNMTDSTRDFVNKVHEQQENQRKNKQRAAGQPQAQLQNKQHSTNK
ncbi:DUF4023 family protein [Paenibacillus sp. VCA1]|uniref:DUF4023 family protein n=1 Tax=Paenibacillus sp. VCA1 TaxID=3039148 RepID=UPI0028713C2A|nr:DUF4023 family protein [Paenibacillus sp. VCA1]MDR9853532.1 DUF4023 family protein [Paenibacillus sp. VCA1]